MATKKKDGQKKMTIAETRKALADAEEQLERLNNSAWCYMCDKHMNRDTNFYYNSNPLVKSQCSSICKTCLKKIALRYHELGEYGEPTKESIIEALRYWDRPFLDVVYDASVQESENLVTGKTKNNAWTAYAKNIQMRQYVGMRFSDSDIFKKKNQGSYDDIHIAELSDEQVLDRMSDDVRDTYEINKKTTIRFLGYDPFENEPIDEQPILYAKLVNYFDESVRDDGLKLEAVIEIVQSFKDVKTINDTISKYKKELSTNPSIIATIKSLAETKQKMINSSLALAKDNGISVNYNNNRSKGAGTLSGIIKEMSEMNLDDIEINTFDYETNNAISDIMQKSYENQMKQLNPDENDWEKEVFHQSKLIKTLQSERDNAVEYCRLLRKENADLKDFLQERNIINEALEVVDG